jgi:hypothetical protein
MKSKIEDMLGVKKLKKEDDFIKLYFNDLGKIWDLSKSSQQVFGEIIQFVEWNPQNSIHNLISLNATKRKLIYSNLNWNIATAASRFSQCLKELSTHSTSDSILLKLSNDTYLLNSKIASKANWADTKVMQSIQLNITYDMVGKTLTTLVELQPETRKEQLKDLLES